MGSTTSVAFAVTKNVFSAFAKSGGKIQGTKRGKKGGKNRVFEELL